MTHVRVSDVLNVMAANCTEGHRKKAKYLLDDEELNALKRSKSGEASSKSVEPPASQQPPPSETQYIQPDPMFYPPTTSYALGAEAANLEYSILSAILGNSPDSGSSGAAASPSAGQPSTSYVPAQSSSLVSASWPAEPLATQYGGSSAAPATGGYAGSSTYPDQQPQPLVIQPSETTLSSSSHPEYIAPSATSYSTTTPYQPGQAPGQYVSSPTLNGASSTYVPSTRRVGNSPGGRGERPVNVGVAAWTGPSLSSPSIGNGGQSVYRSVTKAYDYTEGYHFLMKHLPHRFEKNDILRIVRALAIVRPSLIALQMPMTEEDEVFVEKCFQRSLIELDKLVSFSGTPTVAWRRTGEICLVGPEFCMLTGWEREELIGRRKYIYELFENQSVVEYWENFANHAFENTTQSVYSHCVLLKPSGTPVPCTFCFSIRRDIMDLPSLVIGQWLPLL
ncbi:Transcription activator of gluconeogenesis ERT1 [Grifola frondosa]|uniref:Transcription activator of gluconeogenesis ERT1 n=1 Tax=Grifola frondosa TaxID=5627 RepID=A0A1C7LQJ8_GRIFR|nr:Transcription activator of gluconeogenesis ERT1 [Grifola frondosa]